MNTYVTPDFITEIEDFGKVLAVAAALVSAITAAVRQWVFKPLRSEIKEATRQVATNANGGQSLNDLHKRVDEIEGRQKDMDQKLDLVIEILDPNKKD